MARIGVDQSYQEINLKNKNAIFWRQGGFKIQIDFLDQGKKNVINVINTVRDTLICMVVGPLEENSLNSR